MADPEPVGPLAARLARLSRVADTAGYTPHATEEEPGEDDETVEERQARGLQAWRDHQWTKTIPPAFVAAQLDDLDDLGAAGTAVRDWTLRAGPHPNLVILGPTGVGKTHAAIASLRPAHESGLTVGFYPVSRLLFDLSPGSDHQRETVDVACHTARMVLDDVGIERRTEWAAEQLFHVVNERTLAGNPTIATSNLALPELVDTIGPRIASRLLGGATIVTLTGSDRRRRA